MIMSAIKRWLSGNRVRHSPMEPISEKYNQVREALDSMEDREEDVTRRIEALEEQNRRNALEALANAVRREQGS